MAIVAITNLDTATYSSAFGPILPGATKVFSGLTTAELAAQLATLNALVVAGTANYEALVDSQGLAPGSDVQGKIGALTAAALTTGSLTVSGAQTYSGSVANTPVAVAFADSPYTTAAGQTFLCNATGGNITFNLPAASTISGRSIRIKKTDSSGNTVTVTKAGSDKIDGANTSVLKAQYDYIVLSSDGVSNWNIFASLITP